MCFCVYKDLKINYLGGNINSFTKTTLAKNNLIY